MTTTLPTSFGERLGVSRFIPSSRFSSVIVTLLLLIVMFGIGSSRYRNFASSQNVANLF